LRTLSHRECKHKVPLINSDILKKGLMLEYLLIVFGISFFYFIMMILGKLKIKKKIDDPSAGETGAGGDVILCDSSAIDCSGGGDGG